MRLVFVGAGYVGLVSGTCFAEMGHEVTCFDIDKNKINALREGFLPIHEPGLLPLVKKNVASGNLVFTTEFAQAASVADVVFIAVGTPCMPNTDKVDLSYVYNAAREAIRYLPKKALLVVKSTVPPGTCSEIAKLGCNVVSNPEFLREGAAVQDFMHPDRVVIGVQNNDAKEVMQQLYEKLEAPMLYASLETSELVKYGSNAFLAMKIAFINEISDICDKTGADIQKVAQGVGLDQRIGNQFLQPGPGFGGSCFPKDIRALQDFSEMVMAPSKLVNAVINANRQRLQTCVQKVIEYCGGSVKDKRIAMLGLAFKANTDDIRESPALHLISGLLGAGAKVVAYDPAAVENAIAHFAYPENLAFADSIDNCIEKADVTVIATEWPEFKNLTPCLFESNMSCPVVIDLRNLYANDYFKNTKVKYFSLGRPHSE